MLQINMTIINLVKDYQDLQKRDRKTLLNLLFSNMLGFSNERCERGKIATVRSKMMQGEGRKSKSTIQLLKIL
jgi:hypothetical protein